MQETETRQSQGNAGGRKRRGSGGERNARIGTKDTGSFFQRHSAIKAQRTSNCPCRLESEPMER